MVFIMPATLSRLLLLLSMISLPSYTTAQVITDAKSIEGAPVCAVSGLDESWYLSRRAYRRTD